MRWTAAGPWRWPCRIGGVRRLPLTLALGAVFVAPLTAQTPIPPLGEDRSGVEGRVHAALNALHRAASQADFVGYISRFTDDGVFLGTDATERWPIDEFADYTRLRFDRGRGWTYVPTERRVTVGEDGSVAWFDERLDDANYGETRGSGVLRRVDGGWKVAQYNLTIPIPNAFAGEFTRRIREHGGG